VSRLRHRKPASPHRLNLKFLQRAIRLAKPYWLNEEKKTARWMLLLLILMLVGYTEISVLFNQQSGEFTSALAARNGPRFRRSIEVFFGLLVIGVPIDAYYYYVRDKLALNWRRWLTDRFLAGYFNKRAYYRLVSKPEIDNPDQRISDDIYSFTNQSLMFVLVLANGILQLLAFGRVLWSISTYLVLFLFLYAAVVTATTFGIFGERMVSLHFTQRKREADFRFGLIRVRENAESIALYHGERLEKHFLQQTFGKVYDNAMQVIRWSLGLNFFYYGNSYLTMVLPILIIAPRVLSGELEVGRIVQASGAFAAILAALTLLIDNIEDLSRFAASVGRLETFEHSISPGPVSLRKSTIVSPANGVAVKAGSGKFRTLEGDCLSFENFTLKIPDSERTLIKDLAVSVSSGEGLLIVGASGLGKSSLLRAIAGLWDAGEGVLTRPKPDDALFLPQHAYMAQGSLRVQLNYPNLGRSVSDDELRAVLERVNLRDLEKRCKGFDNGLDFEKILSFGERQRLAFARVLLNNPLYVLLDEATSALDGENETALYEELAEMSTTRVSVSHHPSLVKYHSQVLELRANGAWRLHPAKKFRFVEDLA
jgi:putative ATP-binding cassette transporter